MAKRTRVMEFLNSPFALFLLGSVVLSLITFSYQKYSDWLKQQSYKETAERKIRQELRERIDFLNFYIERPGKDTIPITYGGRLGDITSNLFKGPFEDYANRSNASLFWELEDLSCDPKEKSYLSELESSSREMHRKFTQSLDTDWGVILTHEDKEKLTRSVIGTYQSWQAYINNKEKVKTE